MGTNSKIAWTDHTFNPWWGCTPISAGCRHCYAATLAQRTGFDVFGQDRPRRLMAETYWRQPIRWNRAAEKSERRARVFCGSMCDVFESMPPGYLLNETRTRLWNLIEATPALDWLLLTKRPENVPTMVSAAWADVWPSNVWLGTSVENQETADERIPLLLKVPVAVRFLSCEPLLGPLDIKPYIWTVRCNDCFWTGFEDEVTGPLDWQDENDTVCPTCESDNVARRMDCLWDPGVEAGEADRRLIEKRHSPIDWIIVGGESGPNARPMHPDWARSIRDQCQAAGVPLFVKQLEIDGRIETLPDRWPEDLRIQEFPAVQEDES